MSRRCALASTALPAGLLAAAFAFGIARAATSPLAQSLLAPADWSAAPADGVALALVADRDDSGAPALRLDYDFRGHGGWAAARRALPLALPANYELRFRYRAAGPTNKLEVKLVDAGGENVWWNVAPEVAPSASWQLRRIAKRAFTFAWGPSSAPLARLGFLEITVTAGEGGRGSLWISGLELVEREPVRPYAGTPVARATAADPGHGAGLAVDGDPKTAWSTGAPRAELTVDFGAARELGGLTLRWAAGGAPRAFKLALSEDGERFAETLDLPRAGGERNDLRLPETEARALRLTLERAPGRAAIALAGIDVRPLEWGATPSAFAMALADDSPRGAWPRALTEGSLWTVVGVDGDAEEALFSEDGAIEAGERSFSLEPLLEVGGELRAWNEGATAQALGEGDLPIPTAARAFPEGSLAITALAAGAAGDSRLRVRYLLEADAGQRFAGRLLLALRPFQVNPPQQFLNVTGGVAPIAELACGENGVVVNGALRLRADRAPSRCTVGAFAEGSLAEIDRAPVASEVRDPQGLASALLAFPFDLAPGASSELIVDLAFPDRALPPAAAAGRFADDLERESRLWREELDRVRIAAPAAAAEALATLRSSLAYILVHRDGPAIQPGSRAYARSWIRDGALTGSALLRLGHEEEARAFARWFAPYQYFDGKVPCCVDRRGADPVPENDSHGELIHLVAETWRFTRDRAFLDELFPHVVRAVDYLETLRQSRRTDEFRRANGGIFFGLLPQSISHEGYSAKPMHSYWDDTFADVGLADAAMLARERGDRALSETWSARHRELRADFLASIAAVRAAHGLATLPASAELADFDSTSTTTMLDPGGLEGALPREALEATFQRFDDELARRRSGSAEWSGWTPYEIRHIGAFVRLGWRERAHELLGYYLAERRPRAWKQWPEAVARDVRERRFLGDLPHGWVASDYIRSLLDLFAYERRGDGALVLAAGVPEEWLRDGDRIAVDGLRTPWGPLSYEIARRGGRLAVRIDALARRPEGGIVVAPPGTPPRAVDALPARFEIEVKFKEHPE